jgi:23S rRNA-/tRNA-specific pseudouridylate synthase
LDNIPTHLISATDLAEKISKCKVFNVHRLDMETSGVILFAKTEESSAELCRQFRDHEVIFMLFFLFYVL